MERRLNTKVESYLKQFKDDIRNKVMTQNNEKLNIPELFLVNKLYLFNKSLQ